MSSTHNTDSTPTSGTQPDPIVPPSRSTVPALFTGRHSKALKNSLGLQQELKLSLSFHHHHIPVLVSARLLRERSLGQIDVCRLIKEKSGWTLEIGEIKSSELGVEAMTRGQRTRLFGSLQFLTQLFGARGKLTSLVGLST